jgi:hypothetical protein
MFVADNPLPNPSGMLICVVNSTESGIIPYAREQIILLLRHTKPRIDSVPGSAPSPAKAPFTLNESDDPVIG